MKGDVNSQRSLSLENKVQFSKSKSVKHNAIL